MSEVPPPETDGGEASPPLEDRDRELEVLVAKLLRAGVLLAAVVVLAGGALYLVHHGRESVHYASFESEPEDLRSVEGVVASLPALRARTVIQLGLVLLIATPIARVALSIAGFVKERDWLYVGITLVVLSLLAFGLLAG
jgi:uncharacterized membrane protein